MFKKLLIVLGVLYVVFVAIYWFMIGGSHAALLRNIVYLIPPAIATLAGVFSLRYFGLSGHRARTLVLFTSGMLCWFIGEVIFFSYEFIFHINPYPSIADVFYLLAYPLLFFGLINEIRQAHIQWKKINPAVMFLFVIASLALAVLVGYFGVYVAFTPDDPLINNVISIGYGIGDLLLIITNMGILILAWEFRGGKLSRMWTLIFAGFVATLVADILFAIYTDAYTAEVWFYKSLLDSFWMVGYLLFAAGLFDFGFSILEAKKKLKLQ